MSSGNNQISDQVSDQISDQISDQMNAKQEVWIALSDLFVDNEINYEYIARRVAHMTMQQVERILYFEVAPVCMSNLLVRSPSIRKGFSADYIIPEVHEHLQKMNTDRMYAYKVRLKIKLYKVFLKQEWIKLATEIQHIQTESTDTLAAK